jgi:hypothetical protein
VSRWPLESVPRLAARASTVLGAWVGRSNSSTGFVMGEAVWHFPPRQGTPERVDGLQGWLQSRQGESVRIVLSSRCTHTVLFDAQEATLSASDVAGREALARARLMQVWGASAEVWPLRSWAGQSTHGACAWAQAQAQGWLEAARAAGTRVTSILPWWSLVLDVLSAQEPRWGQDQRCALLLCEGDRALWLVLEDGEVVSMRQRRLVEASAEAAASVSREGRADDRVEAVATRVVGYGLRPSEGAAFDGERVCGALDGMAPEAAWLCA